MKLGKDNVNWKGDLVSYRSLHEWVNNHLPKPKICKCGSIKNIDASNKSGKYKRDISDWEWKCRKCHMEEDGRINNLRVNQLLTGKYIFCVCGKEFYLQKALFNKRKYCSKSCSNINRYK